MVIGVGASGCINDATLAAFLAEITITVDEAPLEAMHVACCDDAVAGIETCDRG